MRPLPSRNAPPGRANLGGVSHERLALTTHARRRLSERGLDGRVVAEVLRDPFLVEPRHDGTARLIGSVVLPDMHARAWVTVVVDRLTARRPLVITAWAHRAAPGRTRRSAPITAA